MKNAGQAFNTYPLTLCFVNGASCGKANEAKCTFCQYMPVQQCWWVTYHVLRCSLRTGKANAHGWLRYSGFGPRTTFQKVPNWTGHHQLSHLTLSPKTYQPQHVKLQVSDFTKLCSLFAKHCLFLSIGRQLSFLLSLQATQAPITHYSHIQQLQSLTTTKTAAQQKPASHVGFARPASLV